MICAVLLHLLKHSLPTSIQIIICAGFAIVQVIVTASPRRMSSVGLCVYVSAIYPDGQKRYISPAKKRSKIIISASIFWLSLFELTHLIGMLGFTLAMLRLVQRP